MDTLVAPSSFGRLSDLRETARANALSSLAFFTHNVLGLTFVDVDTLTEVQSLVLTRSSAILTPKHVRSLAVSLTLWLRCRGFIVTVVNHADPIHYKAGEQLRWLFSDELADETFTAEAQPFVAVDLHEDSVSLTFMSVM